ncbi:hypothetical protein [Spirosoma sp. KNUC1025]|uniref:hypothetical protein n=1 Tax=Spirosoma sp. KNUC1025 TaxID=2894082 RepID=UPI00386DF2DE|nr:hypothetical protein LN737_14330 [Spirosoma sp. KNUC1025]
MKDEILNYLNQPRQLEKLYQTNKVLFKRAFVSLYPDIKGNTLADFWNERLNYESDGINWGTSEELIVVAAASLVAGLIAKLPAILSVNEEFFYSRNVGFIIFPALALYFAWKNKLAGGKIACIAALALVSLLFINFLPDVQKSDTLLLSCIHLPLFLWSIVGFAFVGETRNNVEKRLGYLKYNGDLIVMTGLILIAGGIMTGITVGLFNLIGLDIKNFYFNYIVIVGLPSAPIVGTYLTQTNPQLVDKVSPVLAKLFCPLVLVMLVIYLIAIIYSGKDPYNDREFLLMFNALLIGVMAIIFFSVAETSKAAKSQPEVWVLFLLSCMTILVNGIALSAILFRISEWGITPNRAAVLGGNVLILLNLLFVAVQLFKVITQKGSLAGVGRAIALYLPVYCLWASFVLFGFPLLFGFK